jgi:hypothetical protein
MELHQSSGERYRIEAARIRHQADLTNSEKMRLQFLEIARQYEDLAAVVEQLPQRHHPDRPTTGR